MQRWKDAGRGPKCTLLVGILLGVASIALYQSAYAGATPPYPGSVALPNIGPGPALGCTPVGQSRPTWVSGFNPLSRVSFTVNGRPAGTSRVLSNGAVLVTLTITLGQVSVNGNHAVPTHVGFNELVVLGHKTTTSGTGVVGLRFRFQVPPGTDQSCVPTTTPTVPTSSTTVHPRFPRVTTTTHFMPTTLAKAIESPLQISPNKVILECSLLAAVLAAVLSAGALGSVWAAGAYAGNGPTAVAAADEGGGEGPATPDAPPPGPPEPPAPPEAPAPQAPASPEAGAGPTGAPTAPRMTSAFARRQPPAPAGGGS